MRCMEQFSAMRLLFLYIFLLRSTICWGDTDAGEVNFLQQFYEENGGEGWLWRNESLFGPKWDFSAVATVDPCSDMWQGVECNCSMEQSCRIVKLALNSYSISGSFPSGFDALSRLSILSLNNNTLSSSLPSSLFKLKYLRYLNVELNNLTGTIPDGLYQLDSLERLFFGRNRFHGSISAEIGYLSNLIELNGHYNQLTFSLPSDVWNMSALTSLVLHHNILTGQIMTTLSPKCTRLQRLELHRNGFYGSLPATMGSLTDLSVLFLSHNLFSQSIPSEMSQLKSLIFLYLNNNHFAGHIPDFFSDLNEVLLILDVSSNVISGTIPSISKGMLSLSSIHLSSNLLSGPIPPSFDKAPQLRSFWIDDNKISGPLPSSLASLLQLDQFIILNNYISGTIPAELGQLTALSWFTLNENYFTGSIPDSLTNLSNLELFWLSTNHLEGSIPTSIGNFVKLHSFHVFSNQLTGFIPSSFGNMQIVEEIGLHSNRLSGWIPSELGALQSCERLDFARNDLTGTIPPSLGLLRNLLDIDLSDNSLSGGIPSSIGLMRVLERLAFDSNYLTGTVPSMHVLTLEYFFIQGNLLTGQVRDTFWDPNDVELRHVDVSDNLFSGDLPHEIFLMPNIKSIALSVNCFSGYIPLEICNASSLHALSINGLGAARGCSDAVKSPFSKDVVLFNTLKGSLPECVWHLPTLRILHATGNGLSGSIPDLTSNSTLIDLSIAHNLISGTIPVSVQSSHRFVNLDLSYNNIQGSYEHGHVNDSNVSLSLEVNRLSGKVTTSKLAAPDSIHVLRGNIFSCETLPANDAHVDFYNCGSEDLDTSLFAWLGTSVVILLPCILAWRISYKGNHSDEAGQERQFKFDFREKFFLDRIRVLIMNIDLYAKYLQETSWLMPIRPYIICFDQELRVVSMYLVRLAGVCIVATLPLIVAKCIASGDNSSHFMTHSHVYTWLFSLAYLRGQTAGIATFSAWVLTISCFSIAMFKLRQYAVAEEATQLSSCGDGVRLRRASTRSNSVKSGKYWRMIGLLFCNVVLVVSVNFFYVRLLSGSLLLVTPEMVQLLQFSLALFKMAYSIFCVPIMCKSITDKKMNVWVRIRINVCNSILIPILVAMRTSPNCMEGLFEQGDSYSSRYSYESCNHYVYNSDTGTSCENYGIVHVDVADLIPPFLYHFQCSSAVLTSYIPVFVYAYMFQLMLPIGVFVMTCIPFCTIPLSLRDKFPGIFWPEFWVSSDPENLTDVERKLISNHEACVPTGRKLLNQKSIVLVIMNHFTVLLTFGLCSPLLAAVVIATVLMSCVLLEVFVARFVHFRLYDKVKLESNTVSNSSGDSSGHMEETASTDHALRALDDQLMGTVDMLSICYMPIVVISCIFFAMLSFDMTADEVGWRQALWVPAVFFCFGVAVVLGYTYAVAHFVEDVQLNRLLNSIDEKGLEMEGGVNNPVHESKK